MLYFAYGSNLDWDQMKARGPSVTFISRAKLKDHRLAFTRKSKRRGCGSADAVIKQAHNVWGVVYEIAERNIGSLDQAEGFVPGRTQNAYTRQKRHVYVEGDERKPLLVSVYFAKKQKDPPLPSAEYKRLIVDGAKYWHLPQEYIDELEQIEVAH